MSRLGFIKTLVYHGESPLGEVDFIPVKDDNFRFPNNEIRIHHLSQARSRSNPLSVLQIISESGVVCKLEPSSIQNPTFQSELTHLHSTCFYDKRTAVVVRENDELHLVSMQSRLKRFPSFWCFVVPKGLYETCVGMLNLRCLAIVFDLDETLIVANTMKSFEDRIEQLKGWIASESDNNRFVHMSAEMNRYMEDRALLKQYAENDCILDGGKTYKVQHEEVPKLFEGHGKFVRPIIRLPEKNIVLTRINPENRDTSVLVRLRPAWEDIKNYLTTKDRKRFEVYVCTMAERDYALEMWRLLDPQAHLISLKELLDRVVCVRSGARKSLVNVFQGRECHPKMAMVIDDRLKVWEDKDQPRVHVVPAFTPYFAPQAEMVAVVPILCVARNVACSVRGSFFNYFDEHMEKKIADIHYEDELAIMPPAPDVSNFLMIEETGFQSNGNADTPFPEGLIGPEVAQRVKDMKNLPRSDNDSLDTAAELKSESCQLPVAANPNVFGPVPLKGVLPSEKPGLLGAPYRRDNNFSESDPNGKMRFAATNCGQDIRYRCPEPPLIPKLPGQFQTDPHGGFSMEEDHKTGNVISRTTGLVQEPDTSRFDKQRSRKHSHSYSTLAKEEVNLKQEGQKQNQLQSLQYLVGGSQSHLSGNSREHQCEGAKGNLLPLCIGALHEIGRKCNSKVEFKSVMTSGEDLQFSFEVLFTGEKIGFGMGKTRKDAQQQAAENALQNLAEKYLLHTSRYRAADKETDKLSPLGDNGFIWETINPGSDAQMVENGLPKNYPTVGAIPDDIAHE